MRVSPCIASAPFSQDSAIALKEALPSDWETILYHEAFCCIAEESEEVAIMLVDKPDWVEHGGSPIFSIDVHPAGTRFVTSGSDHKAKVWNLLPVLEAQQEENKQCPRLLATLTDHFGPVNVARFSRSGRLLATGSDDKLICLYELRPGAGHSSFGSNDGPNVENWKHFVTLRGHSNNITDLAWSKDDTYLATCSLDNSIIIWNPLNGQQVTTLQGHESYVKGVAWDPIGKYLASQSDDRTMRVWRVEDWVLVATVSEPFQKGWVSNTFSLRLGWSPEGQSLTAVNSYQSPCHTVALLDRRTWKYDFSMVGHSGAIVKACYNPKIMRSVGGADEATCIALGSQDTKLTVWLSNIKRPTFVAHKLFKQSVVDLAWTPDGYSLLACSTDGTLAVLQFEPKELGVPLNQAEVDGLLKTLYGSSGSKPTLFAESAGQLQLEAAATNGHAATPPGQPTVRHQNPPVGLAARMQPAGGIPSGVGPSALAPQTEARLTNGQRRVAPMPLQPTASGSNANRITPQPMQAPLQSATAQLRPMQPQPPQASSRPVQGSSAPAPAVGTKRKAAEGAAPPSKRLVAERIDGRPGASQSAAVMGESPGRAARSQLSLPAAEALLSQQLHAGEDEPSGMAPVGQVPGRLVLDAANDLASGADRATADVVCSCSGKQVWADRVSGCVVCLAGSQNYAAVGLRDGSLQVYTPAGRRLLPAMQLGSAPVFLVSDGGWRLLAVSQTGSLHLWDLKDQRLIVEASMDPLLQPLPTHVTVVSVRLSGAGVPLAVLSNSTAYALHLGMKTWMRVADSNFSYSSYMSLYPSGASSAGDLSQVQGQALASSGSPLASGIGPLAAGRSRTAGVDRAHLETNMAAALLLQSQQEYRRWLLTYVRHLAGDAEEGRLRELCEGLLGPIRRSGEGGVSDDAPRILGLDMRKVFCEDVLREVSRNRMHQRLVSEFQELLNEVG